jgi:gas vesicle protein
MTTQTENEDAANTSSGGNDSLKYLLTFLGGLAAGVALGLYLNSKQGKKIRNQVKQRMSALELEITDKVNAAMDEINNLTDKGGMPKEKEQDSNNA